MELWDALKGRCQSQFKLIIIIDLNKRLQDAKCGEDNDIRVKRKIDQILNATTVIRKDTSSPNAQAGPKEAVRKVRKVNVQRPPRNNDCNNNNRNRYSNRYTHNRNRNVNQNIDNANSANADIEAWGAIEEIEETQATIEEIDKTEHPDIQQIVYSAGY